MNGRRCQGVVRMSVVVAGRADVAALRENGIAAQHNRGKIVDFSSKTDGCVIAERQVPGNPDFDPIANVAMLANFCAKEAEQKDSEWAQHARRVIKEGKLEAVPERPHQLDAKRRGADDFGKVYVHTFLLSWLLKDSVGQS